MTQQEHDEEVIKLVNAWWKDLVDIDDEEDTDYAQVKDFGNKLYNMLPNRKFSWIKNDNAWILIK